MSTIGSCYQRTGEYNSCLRKLSSCCSEFQSVKNSITPELIVVVNCKHPINLITNLNSIYIYIYIYI
jgi:hypothetical protein